MEGHRRKAFAVAATALSFLALLCWSAGLKTQGLSLRITDLNGDLVRAYSHAALDTFRVDSLVAVRPRLLRARWDGYWQVPGPGFSSLVLKTDGKASVQIDDEPILQTDGGGAIRAVRRVEPGPHRVRVDYESSSNESRQLLLKGVTEGDVSIGADRRDLSAEPKTARRSSVRTAARVAGVAALVLWIAYFLGEIRGHGRERFLARAPFVLVAVITVLAAALRFEALVTVYWGVDAPIWADALAAEVHDVRPGAFQHQPTQHPYEGDPFSYLGIARTMGGFYEPSSREPLFPALTRLALFLANDRDIGISFLSAFASTLTCLAIFALAWQLALPWAGVMAAFLWAIEWQAISLSVNGWRDDLFTLEVTACAAALLAFHRRSDRRSAIVLGVLAGLTLLTRLTAFSFLVPGVVVAVLMPSAAARHERARTALIAAVVMLALVGPFMLACALAFGDPFYSINVHAAFYRSRAGLSGTGGSSVAQLFSQLLSPWEFLSTGFIGLTSFPFENKWFGLGALVPGLNEPARLLALLGLPILIWRASGLLTLTILFSAIVPYAWTWNIPGGDEWRFTLPAYPFYLLSASVAVESMIRGIAGMFSRAAHIPTIKGAIRIVVTLALGVVLFIQTGRCLEWQRVTHELASGRAALISAQPSSRVFFRSGWTRVGGPNSPVSFRLSSAEGSMRVPVVRGSVTRVTLRLGSDAQGEPEVDVFIDDQSLAKISGPRLVGATAVLELTPQQTGTGDSVDLRFVESSPSHDHRFSILWVRIEPSSPPSS